MAHAELPVGGDGNVDQFGPRQVERGHERLERLAVASREARVVAFFMTDRRHDTAVVVVRRKDPRIVREREQAAVDAVVERARARGQAFRIVPGMRR